MELAGEHTRSGGCGSIGFDAEQLTGVDSIMMVTLKGLPEALRGVAWPTSARTMRRALKCVNEQDPRRHLLLSSPEGKHHDGTAGDEPEEGVDNVRSVWPEYPRLHAAYNGWYNATRHRKVKLIAENQSKYGLRIAIYPHEAGIPSRRTS